MMTLSENVKFTNIDAAESTATTGSTSASVDMQGYDSVVFIRKAGAARTFTVEACDDATATGSYVALAQPTVTTTATGVTAILEVVKPTQRFLRLVVGAGVTAVYSEAYALQYGTRNAPVTNASAATDGFSVDIHVTPTT